MSSLNSGLAGVVWELWPASISFVFMVLRRHWLVVEMAVIPYRYLPAEDAVILFQYSRNLAEHGAITFLSGGPHVEGATDFAWMVLVAAVTKCGLTPFWFCAAANVLSLLGLALLLLK